MLRKLGFYYQVIRSPRLYCQSFSDSRGFASTHETRHRHLNHVPHHTSRPLVKYVCQYLYEATLLWGLSAEVADVSNSVFPLFCKRCFVCASWNTFTEHRHKSYIQPSSVSWAWSQQGFPSRGVGDGPYFVWPGTSLSFSHRGPYWEYYYIRLHPNQTHAHRGGSAERTWEK